MRLPFSRLAVTAGVLSAATALSPKEIRPDTPVSSLLSTAQVHLAKRETSEALVYYDAAIAKDPKNYLTFFKRATVFLSIGRPSQATEDLNEVLALKPGLPGAHVQLAKIKSRAADWAGAQADYIAAGKTSDSPELVELKLAEEAAEAAVEAVMRHSWDECISNAGTAIVVASRSLKLREMRSNCRFFRGDIEEGISDLQHVLYLNPGDTTPHIVISATKSYALGDLDNGLEQIRKCLHSDPDSKTCKTFHKRGKAVQKALNKAIGQLKKGQPTTAGRTIVGTEEEPGLISMIEEHIKELRESGFIPEKAGSKLLVKIIDMACQAYSESSHKQAEKYCNEALELNAESFWGLMFRARSLLKKEEYEAAIKTLENANELHPEMQEKISPVMKKARIALKRSKTKDYYKVLGVANDADERQIKSAYRKASKKYHPDKAHKQGFSKEEAEKKMASINEAYEVLSNPELRARFDHGDDPNSQESNSHFQGNPFGSGDGHHFMFQQGGQQFKFNFPGGGGPFGF